MKTYMVSRSMNMARACCDERGKSAARPSQFRTGAALACAAVVAAGTIAAHADTAVLNGGFESGVLAPWTYSSPPSPAPTAAAARSGQYGLEVTGWGPPAWVRQDIQDRLIAGAVYHFTASLDLLEVNSMPDLPPMYVPHLSVHADNNPSADVWAHATNTTGLGWQNLEVSRSFTAQELQGAVKVDIGGMGRMRIDDVSGDLLANRSFDKAGGANWSSEPSVGWAPFAVSGEVDLHRSYTGSPVRMLWQNLSISNVAGATGTAGMRLKSTSSWPTAGTISTKVYLDYLDSSGNPQRALLLAPDNSTVAAPPDGTPFSTNFTLPANAQQVTGFSVDRCGPGLFQAMDFHLNLVAAAPVAAPVVTVTSPAEADTFASGATIPLMAEVDNSGGAVVTGVEFYDNGTLIGQGLLSVFGEWAFPNDTHLSVLGNGLDGFVDYNPPSASNEPMYTIFGVFPTPTSCQGVFNHFPATGEVSGNASIGFSLGAGDTLNANITGDSPLGVRNLAGGLRQSFPLYTLSWANAASGPHALTARVYYGTGSHATSAPVNISVSPPPTPFEAWQGMKFTPQEITDGKAGMAVDFENDGNVNLLEYAFHTEPKTRNVSPVVVALKSSKMEISFPCHSGRTDISYTVQASTTLAEGSWTDIAKSTGGATTAPLNGSGCTIHDTGIGLRVVRVVEADPIVGKRFLRMKVTSP